MTKDEKALAELQKMLDKHMKEFNETPHANMDNLSPNDMQYILYNTFHPDSPIQYKKPLDNQLIAQSPFYSLFRIFLDKINTAKELKLTPKGHLPVQLCKDLYSTGLLKEEGIEAGWVKLYKEETSIVITNLRILGLLTKMTKKRNNKLSLTKTGEKLYHSADHFPLFKNLFEFNAFQFNLGYHDGFHQEAKVQYVLGYTIYLLLKYGSEKRDLQFYADKNLTAFPHLLEEFEYDWSTPERQYFHCYNIRIFERLLAFYGFVEIVKTRIPGSYDDQIMITATDLFRAVFELKKENFRFKRAEVTA